MAEVRHVAVLLKSLKGGGMQTSMMRLAAGLQAQGVDVDVVIAGRLEGPLRAAVPANVRLFYLSRSWAPWWTLWRALHSTAGRNVDRERIPPLPVVPPRGVRYLPSLIRYMKRERPDALIAGGTIYNVIAVWARRLAQIPTRILVSQRNPLSAEIGAHEARGQWHWRHAKYLVAQTYPLAEAVVGNSDGIAEDLAHCAGLSRDAVETIYNPVTVNEIAEKAAAPIEHPWFAPGLPPVVLAVGRLHPQKDFRTLLHAFARLRSKREARLMILGEDSRHAVREQLLALAQELGVAADVDLPGFAGNPYAYMARAGVFVLSSRNEGFPNVLVEALACGCPVVSTRCPHGPDEILDGGRYGHLVDVGDATGMARAIAAALDQLPDREMLAGRAGEFSVDRATDRYLACLQMPSTAPVPEDVITR